MRKFFETINVSLQKDVIQRHLYYSFIFKIEFTVIYNVARYATPHEKEVCRAKKLSNTLCIYTYKISNERII